MNLGGWVSQRKKIGGCICCIQSAKKNSVYCEKHAKKHATHETKRQKRLKAAGLCKSCGKCPRRSNRTTCEKCFLKESIQSKQKREERLSKNICPDCGKESLTENKKRCFSCRLRNRIVQLDVFPSEKLKVKEAMKNFEGRCQSCGTSDSGTNDWHLDHDHKTKMFRGIVCGRCNQLFGFAKDNPETLRKAIKYLTERNFNVSMYRKTKK